MSESSSESEVPDETMKLDGLQEQQLDSFYGSNTEEGITFDLQDQNFDTFEKGADPDGIETR